MVMMVAMTWTLYMCSCICAAATYDGAYADVNDSNEVARWRGDDGNAEDDDDADDGVGSARKREAMMVGLREVAAGGPEAVDLNLGSLFHCQEKDALFDAEASPCPGLAEGAAPRGPSSWRLAPQVRRGTRGGQRGRPPAVLPWEELVQGALRGEGAGAASRPAGLGESPALAASPAEGCRGSEGQQRVGRSRRQQLAKANRGGRAGGPLGEGPLREQQQRAALRWTRAALTGALDEPPATRLRRREGAEARRVEAGGRGRGLPGGRAGGNCRADARRGVQGPLLLQGGARGRLPPLEAGGAVTVGARRPDSRGQADPSGGLRPWSGGGRPEPRLRSSSTAKRRMSSSKTGWKIFRGQARAQASRALGTSRTSRATRRPTRRTRAAMPFEDILPGALRGGDGGRW